MTAGKEPKLRLILASTSVYRKQLLERLGIPFTVAAPNVDESPLPGESAADLVGRLARTKAEVVARRSTHSLVIGSDQLAMCGRDVLGKPGSAFVIAQTRLGGGRIHHAMRTVAMVKRALTMLCERALSRRTQGEILAQKQMVQQYVADSFIQLEQFRLLVIYTAWLIDKGRKKDARTYIAAVKVAMADVLHDVVRRSLHVHGALGCSNEMPLSAMWMAVPVMGIADGPTEVHKLTVAKAVLSQHKPSPGLWPTEFLPDRVAAARAHFAAYLEREAGNQ